VRISRPPHQLKELLAGHDPIGPPRKLGEQAQFPDREHQRAATGAGQGLLGKDFKRPDS
jgi:hypothetical protein